MNWMRDTGDEPIPGYKLIEPLGTGGFGEVWKCVAPGGLHKAIKFVYGNLNTNDADSVKADQELRALERVKVVRHPFVLPMDRIEIVDGELIIVMELADRSLHDLMIEYQSNGRPGIPREVLLGLMSDAAEGLDHLNEKHNLQHLDVKPKNLFLLGDRIKVADFGLVKHLERQGVSGIMGGITPVYASPETFANKFSKHSDQYSLAAMYVEMLSGQRPFNGKNIRHLAIQHMTEAPNLTMLDEPDREPVARALAKDPTQRFPSCQAFVAALGGATLRSELSNGRSASIPLQSRFDEPDRLRVPQSKRPVVHDHESIFDLAETVDTPDPSFDQTVGASVTFGLDEGVLRPAIIIGIGSFGEQALEQIRCRLLDRVGDLKHTPSFRFLYVTTEPRSKERNLSTISDSMLQPEQKLELPLHGVSQYRRRQLDELLDWLPREKLYTIPRSPRVQGCRAFARLAFVDNFLRFSTRLRQELQIASHPEALRQTSEQTGLPIRSKVPSIFILASATGGSGGMLLDLGHGVRHVLERMNIHDAPMTAMIYAGAPGDSDAPPKELANLFATLTELNHYSEMDVTFSANYGGPDGAKIEARGLPFNGTYLLPMANHSTDAFRDCVTHLSAYLTHNLTTPLGTGLERLRQQPTRAGRMPFRGFGTFGVWYPRGLLLRAAARQLSLQLLEAWNGPVPQILPTEAQAVARSILDDERLSPGPVQQFIADESATTSHPIRRIETWLHGLVEEANHAAQMDDPLTWVRNSWEQLRDWVGSEPTSAIDGQFRRGQLSQELDVGLERAVAAWKNELTELARPVQELPGPRLAIEIEVWNQLLAQSEAAIRAIENQRLNLSARRQRYRVKLEKSLAQSDGRLTNSVLDLFGRAGIRTLRQIAQQFQDYTRLRIDEDLLNANLLFYHEIHRWFEQQIEAVHQTRERIRQLCAVAEEQPEASPFNMNARETPYGNSSAHIETTLQETSTVRVVFPEGQSDLRKSARGLINELPEPQHRQLELLLTQIVIGSRGGLGELCKLSTDLHVTLTQPMTDQTAAFLAHHLPSHDVSEVELNLSQGNRAVLADRVQHCIRAAKPMVPGPSEDERTYVLVPDTKAGRNYAAVIEDVSTVARTIPVRASSSELMYFREQGCMRSSDLFELLERCWDAYQERVGTLETNPHSRYDITNWLPLVE